jgi:hypothetical protein
VIEKQLNSSWKWFGNNLNRTISLFLSFSRLMQISLIFGSVNRFMHLWLK